MADEDVYESLPDTARPLDHMMAGALAGIMEHCIIYPVDVVKTRMMCLKPDPNARYTGIIDAFVKIVKNEGAFRPVRGMGVVAFGAGPAHALYFSCYEFIKSNFSGASKAGDNPLVNGIAGCFATLLHDAVMVPSDTIKQRLQMYNSPYKGLVDCVVKIRAEEGFKALYRSYFTQLNMNIPFQVTHLVTYDYLQSKLNPDREYSPMTHSVSGAIAGATAAAITTPLDVCKTLINTRECCNPDEPCKSINVINKTTGVGGLQASQAAPSGNPTSGPAGKINHANLNLLTSNSFIRNQSTTTASPLAQASGLFDAIKIVHRTHGIKGFFRGIMPRTVFQIPGTAVSWSVYEYYKDRLKSRDQPGHS